jgi:sugar lactone lactonase YvrE
MGSVGLRASIGAALIACLALAAPAGAVTLKAGDLIVADVNGYGGTGGLTKVDPATGIQETISQGNLFNFPAGVVFDAKTGTILVADAGALGGVGCDSPGACGGVIRVDPATGAQTPVSSGDKFDNPNDLVLDAQGRILVTDNVTNAGTGNVIRVDPSTGAQSVVATGDKLVDPFGLALDSHGQILVADSGAFSPPGYGGVIRVDPDTGVQSVVSQSPQTLAAPFHIDVDAHDRIFLTVPFGNPDEAVASVDPVSGSQQPLIAGNPPLDRPVAVTFNPVTETLVVGNRSSLGSTPDGELLRVDPASGLPSALAVGNQLADPFAIAVVPPQCAGRFATIVGDQADNVVRGTPAADVIAGLAGKDKLKGFQGDDVLCGGPGKDKLKGGPGKDLLRGEGGKDFLSGGKGKDKLRGGPGKNVEKQ